MSLSKSCKSIKKSARSTKRSTAKRSKKRRRSTTNTSKRSRTASTFRRASTTCKPRWKKTQCCNQPAPWLRTPPLLPLQATVAARTTPIKMASWTTLPPATRKTNPHSSWPSSKRKTWPTWNTNWSWRTRPWHSYMSRLRTSSTSPRARSRSWALKRARLGERYRR